jgi:hypothetical protein
MNFKTALILTFSPREKELPLPLGQGWGEGNPLVVSPIDYYF